MWTEEQKDSIRYAIGTTKALISELERQLGIVQSYVVSIELVKAIQHLEWLEKL